jgi:hypothetical protein
MRFHHRPWRRWLLVLVISSAIVVGLRPCPVFACSCVPPGTPAQELNRSSTVFAGVVIGIDEPPARPAFTTSFPFLTFLVSSGDPVRVTFDVSAVWKGPAYRQLAVTTPRWSASCGYPFQRGVTYLVYASDQDGELTTYLCSRTNSLALAQADLADLGPGAAPTLDQAPAQGRLGEIFLVVGCLSVPLMIVAGFMVARRRLSGGAA